MSHCLQGPSSSSISVPNLISHLSQYTTCFSMSPCSLLLQNVLFFSCFCIWELNLSNSDLVFYHLNSEDELFRNNCFLVDFYYYFSAKLALCWNIWYTWLHTHIHRKSDEIRTNGSILKFLKNFVGLPKKYFVNFKSLKNIPNYSRYLFYLAFIKLICLDLVKTTQILFIYYF